MIPTQTPQDVQAVIASGTAIDLIDVRTPYPSDELLPLISPVC